MSLLLCLRGAHASPSKDSKKNIGRSELKSFQPGGKAGMPSSLLGLTTFSSTSPFIFMEGEQRSPSLVPRQKQTEHCND